MATISSRSTVSASAASSAVSLVSLSVGGITYTNNLVADSLSIRLSIKDRTDSLTFDVVLSHAKDISPVPRVGQIVTLDINNNREFGGIVQSVREKHAGTNSVFLYSVECADFTRWFDRHLVQQLFLPTGEDPAATMRADQMVQYIVSNVVNKAPFQFTTVLTEGPDLSQQSFNFVTPSSAIDKIAKLAEYHWYIDYYGAVHFGPASSIIGSAPIGYVEHNTEQLISDVELSEEGDQITSVAIIKDTPIEQTQTYTQNLGTANGQEFFNLGYQPANLKDTTVTVTPTSGPASIYTVANGKLLEENVGGKPGDGQTRDVCLLCIPNWGIRFEVPPPTGATVSAQYKYVDIGDTVFVVTDGTSVSEIKAREGSSSDGIYEELFDTSDMESPSENAVRARALIYLKGRRHTWTMTFTVFGSWTKPWRPGQQFTYVGNKRFANALVNGSTFYVTDVTKTMTGPMAFKQEITATSLLYGELV